MKKFFKMGCLGFIALIVIIIIIAVATSGGSDDNTGTTDTDSNESSDSTKSEAKVVAGIGEVVPVGDVEFTVNSTSTASNVGGDFGVNSQGTFLLVDVTVTNKGSEAITVDSSFFKLNAGEKVYESDSSAGIYANDEAGFFLEQVNPDLSITGTVVFDVTDEVIANTDLTLNVQTGLFGTEQGQIKIAQ